MGSGRWKLCFLCGLLCIVGSGGGSHALEKGEGGGGGEGERVSGSGGGRLEGGEREGEGEGGRGGGLGRVGVPLKTRERLRAALWEAHSQRVEAERLAWTGRIADAGKERTREGERERERERERLREERRGRRERGREKEREEEVREHTVVRAGDPLSHEFDSVDAWFFRRARKAERMRRHVAGGPRKVAFMFLTRGPMPLDAVWERFFKGYEELYSVYLLAPPGFEYNSSTTVASSFYGRQISPTFKVSWAGHGVLRAERRLLATALTEPRNYMFVLLSDSCAPLWNLTYIHRYLTRSRNSYVASIGTPFRWTKNYEPDIPLLSWRKGSQWFAIIRDHALEVINDTNIYDAIVMRSTHYIMNEHYVQTLLGMKDPARVENRPVTYVEWRPENFLHPHTFASADIRRDAFALVRSLNATAAVKFQVHAGWNRSVQCTVNGRPRHCFLFARKFSSEVRHGLLYLAEKVFFQ